VHQALELFFCEESLSALKTPLEMRFDAKRLPDVQLAVEVGIEHLPDVAAPVVHQDASL
jgi:hypothetical protein